MFRHRSQATCRTMMLAVLIVLLGIVAAACSPADASHGRAASTPSSTPAISGVLSRPSLRFNSAASADLDNLHIQTNGVDCKAWVVLNGAPRATYDAGTIEQMRNYVSSYGDQYYDMQGLQFGPTGVKTVFTPQFAATLPPVPSTLQVVPGSSICAGNFAFTNTGTTDIQLAGVQATLTSASENNNFAYRLVDTCTLIGTTQGPCSIGGAAPPCEYFARVQLSGGSTGTKVDTPITQAGSGGNTSAGTCPTPVIVPAGGTTEVIVTFSSTPRNLLYTVKLSVDLVVGTTAMTVDLPDGFNIALAFATDSQFSCYALHDSTFISVPIGRPDQNGNYAVCV